MPARQTFNTQVAIEPQGAFMNIEILAYEETPLGILCLRRRELVSKPGTMVTEVTLNHEFLMSSYLNESERSLTQRGLQLVSNQSDRDGLRVLVGGLGLGYTAAQALSSEQVQTVEVIEFLPQVIQWTRDNLIPLSPQLNSDPRLKITHDDVYAKLTGPTTDRFDLIAIDVDHSPEDVLGEQSHGFYTQRGLSKVAEHLNPDGVLGIWSYAEDTPLLEKMRAVFCDVAVEQVTAWNDLINEEMTDWLFYGRKKSA